MKDVEAKKEQKFAMLDQFVKLLAEYSDSQHLHQEIGLYLGVDKFKLGEILPKRSPVTWSGRSRK